MSRIIAITNQKGGVGKTTTTVNLAASLAAMGRSVLVIDLDPQGNATVGAGVQLSAEQLTVRDVLTQQADAADVVMATPNGFNLLPANSTLTATEAHLLKIEGREQRLREALKPIRGYYDYMLMDCPPNLSVLTLNALIAADSVLIPVQCEYYALEGLTRLIKTIQQLKTYINPDLAIDGILRTMYDGRNRLTREVSEQLIQYFNSQVYHTVIPRNVRLAEAPSHGQASLRYDARSQGALAYLALAGELIQRHSEKLLPTEQPLPVEETA